MRETTKAKKPPRPKPEPLPVMFDAATITGTTTPTRLAKGGLRPADIHTQRDPLDAARELMTKVFRANSMDVRRVVKAEVPQLVTELRALARWGGTPRHSSAVLADAADAIARVADFILHTTPRDAATLHYSPDWKAARAALATALTMNEEIMP